MITCPMCQTPNQDNARTCQRCHGMLPRFAAPLPVFEYVMGRYRQFENASQAAMQGVWTPQELGHFLEVISATLAEKARATVAFIEESGYQEYGWDEVDMGLDGIRHYEAGMETMYAFVSDPDPQHLVEGLELIKYGNDRINEAMRRNREERARLAEEWPDMP